MPFCKDLPLCELNDQWQSYEVMYIFQNGSHSVKLYFRLRFLRRLTFIKVSMLFAYQILTRCPNPRPRYYYFRLLNTNAILIFYSGFDFHLYAVIGMWFCTGLLIFVRHRRWTTQLWRCVDFLRWRLYRPKFTPAFSERCVGRKNHHPVAMIFVRRLFVCPSVWWCVRALWSDGTLQRI